ncbi:hypothetical protein EYD10_05826 [Varanus komodoensis]|nr:hypothetical protein EYD10_05826 [Varanus komodoensis]
MAARTARRSRALERWARLVRSLSRGDDVLRGNGGSGFPQQQRGTEFVAVARVKMAGVADAAAPGGGDGGRRSAPEHSLLQPDSGQRRSSFTSGESRSPHPSPARLTPSPSTPPSPNPGQHQRTETLGFYESDPHRQQKRSGPSDLSLLRFINAELTRGYFLEHNEAKYTERRERVYTCMRIPRELEKLMIFGIFLCLDAFLYVFTLLPLRVFLAMFRFITLPCYGLCVANFYINLFLIRYTEGESTFTSFIGWNVMSHGTSPRDRRLLQPAQVCDIFKGVILVICYFMMHYVDYSMMYHLIRGQSVIKLYIIYNMLEVGVITMFKAQFLPLIYQATIFLR